MLLLHLKGRKPLEVLGFYVKCAASYLCLTKSCVGPVRDIDNPE
jgi:hypothetical protein